jgi:hypothetical protein
MSGESASYVRKPHKPPLQWSVEHPRAALLLHVRIALGSLSDGPKRIYGASSAVAGLTAGSVAIA